MHDPAYIESCVNEILARIDGKSQELPLLKGRHVQAPSRYEPNPVPIVTWSDLHSGLFEDEQAN